MNRSMREANRKIFSYLKDYSEKSGVSFKFYNNQRIELEKESQEWLKKLEILAKQTSSLRLKFAFMKYKKNIYFVSIGLNIDSLDQANSIDENLLLHGLNRIPDNGGIFIALVADLDIPIRSMIQPRQIVDEVFYDLEENQIAKYDYQSISKFFEPIQVYEITNECRFIDNECDQETLWRASVFFIANLLNTDLNDFPMNFLDFKNSRQLFINLCLDGSSKISYENLFYSLTSSSWKHSFLEIYRCIEWLFEIAFISLLYENIQLKDLSFANFNSLFKEFIGWKPREEDALEKLFEKVSQNTLSYLELTKDNQTPSSFIYQLRCSIVHFSPDPKKKVSFKDFKDNTWDNIISFCLMAVKELYEYYDTYLFE